VYGKPHDAQCRPSIDLYQTMEPAKKNRDWPEQYIDGIADKVRHKFDELGEDHPRSECVDGIPGLPDWPVSGSLQKKEPQQTVTNDCRWHQSRYMDGVSAPGLLTEGAKIVSAKSIGLTNTKDHLLPDMTLREHARNVAPPITASPSQALFQELRVVL
jgi:hypothetical protein